LHAVIDDSSASDSFPVAALEAVPQITLPGQLPGSRST